MSSVPVTISHPDSSIIAVQSATFDHFWYVYDSATDSPHPIGFIHKIERHYLAAVPRAEDMQNVKAETTPEACLPYFV